MNFQENLELYNLCIQDNIPIIRQQTAKIIESIILEKNYHSLLEIGTAYGYSCSLWIQIPNLTTIYSIEKLENNYQIAQKYLFGHKQLKLINGDAFQYNPDQKFDLIFVDGPKSHQHDLIVHYMHFLNPNGIFIIDNLLLKKFRDIPTQNRTKNQNKLIEKLDQFIKWLNQLEGWSFKFIDIDDGIGLLTRK